VKKPKWLRWESSETKSDNLKKVRRQTDQRTKQQDVQKAQRDEARKIGRPPFNSRRTGSGQSLLGRRMTETPLNSHGEDVA
jgi:hypothetical protein